MITTQTVLTISANGREYKLHCSNDSPLGELFDVLCQMKQLVINKIKDSQPAVDAAPGDASVPVESSEG